jgi:hypothetical protein
LVADQSAPAALNPDPPFRAVFITAFVPVPVMATVLVVTMKPDPAIVPYPMASHPEKIRAGRRWNLFGILRGRSVFHDFRRGRRWRWSIMIIAITMIVTVSMIMAILPAAIDPNPAVIVAIPVAWYPDRFRARPAIPMASDPFPMVSIPRPSAFHPEKVRAGRWASVFIPRRRRSFVYDHETGHTNADGKADIRPRRERCA